MEMNEPDNEDARTIFCANLHERVTEELLYELFLQAGPLERVKIPSNNNYGFVTYQHECSVDYALEVFKDTFLYGSALRLKRRQQKYRENEQMGGPQSRSGARNAPNPLQTGNYSHLGNMNHPGMMPLMANSRNGDSRHSYRSRSPPRRDYRPPPRNHFDNRQNKRYDYDDKYNDQRHNHNDRRSHKRYKR